MFYPKEYVCSPVEGVILPPERPTIHDYEVPVDQSYYLLDKQADNLDKFILEQILHDRRGLLRTANYGFDLDSDQTTPKRKHTMVKLEFEPDEEHASALSSVKSTSCYNFKVNPDGDTVNIRYNDKNQQKLQLLK